jgi:hypothetical protein
MVSDYRFGNSWSESYRLSQDEVKREVKALTSSYLHNEREREKFWDEGHRNIYLFLSSFKKTRVTEKNGTKQDVKELRR